MKGSFTKLEGGRSANRVIPPWSRPEFCKARGVSLMPAAKSIRELSVWNEARDNCQFQVGPSLRNWHARSQKGRIAPIRPVFAHLSMSQNKTHSQNESLPFPWILLAKNHKTLPASSLLPYPKHGCIWMVHDWTVSWIALSGRRIPMDFPNLIGGKYLIDCIAPTHTHRLTELSTPF